MDPQVRLRLAREQLAKVQVAWLDPVDWSDLTIYGMHACENAVVAAAEALDISVKRTHWDKVDVADRLHNDHKLPDIAALLRELNELRKGFAYGEMTIDPTMSAEDIAGGVEHYLDAVSDLLERVQT
ncbi:hypothetical protein BH20ACT23_BH20ACT23_30130 [soil metagenome]